MLVDEAPMGRLAATNLTQGRGGVSDSAMPISSARSGTA